MKPDTGYETLPESRRPLGSQSWEELAPECRGRAARSGEGHSVACSTWSRQSSWWGAGGQTQEAPSRKLWTGNGGFHDFNYRARICKPFKEPGGIDSQPGGIDSSESDPGLLNVYKYGLYSPYFPSSQAYCHRKNDDIEQNNLSFDACRKWPWKEKEWVSAVLFFKKAQ